MHHGLAGTYGAACAPRDDRRCSLRSRWLARLCIFFMAPTSCFADVDARVGFCHGSAQCRVLLCVSRRMLRLSLQGTEAESQSVCAERSRVLQAARAHA